MVDGGGDPRLTALLQRHAIKWEEEFEDVDEGGSAKKRFVSLDYETGEARAKGGEGGGGKSRGAGAVDGDDDFFGLLSGSSTVWVGAPTIDANPGALIDGRSEIDVRVGWRVTEVERRRGGGSERQEGGGGGGALGRPPPPSARWRVSARPPAPPAAPPPAVGVGAPEPSVPSPSSPSSPSPRPQEAIEEGTFDAVVLSDASVMRAGSASAVRFGSAESEPPSAPLGALSRSRRAPLFSVAALLPRSLSSVPFDVAVISRRNGGGSNRCDVSVIVRESAKPGRRRRTTRKKSEERGERDESEGDEGEVWVAVSSREAAAELLALAPPSKGLPPPGALERAAERLWEAASTALQRSAAAAAAGGGGGIGPFAVPPPLALRAQRWGAVVETNADPGSLFSLDESGTLASCGDVFGKGDAASALLSGIAAGEALLRAAAENKRKERGARSSL